ncbi:hypothetical protein IAD21_01638 [Abditibacteriota bacterium]|nr:hypothetical protein IAD21_01638 [Abditibacteriota bacterium]
MKNQLIWTFQQCSTALPNDTTSQSTSYTSAQQEFSNSFVTVSRADFGVHNLNTGEAMTQIYQLAYERTQAQQQEREAELQRFEQLLEDVRWSDSITDS